MTLMVNSFQLAKLQAINKKYQKSKNKMENSP